MALQGYVERKEHRLSGLVSYAGRNAGMAGLEAGSTGGGEIPVALQGYVERK